VGTVAVPSCPVRVGWLTRGIVVPMQPWFERIGATDLQQLVTDVGPVPANVGGVLLLEPAATLDPQEAVRLLRARVAGIPRLRQRLLDTPLGGGRPVWVDDAAFDPARHVTLIACPPPGDDRALLDLAAGIVTEPLDRSVPLWRARVVSGLASGGCALVLALHHVLADGLGGLAVLADLMDTGPAARATADPPPPRPVPSPARLRRDARDARIRAVRQVPHAVASLGPALAELGAGRVGRAPRTSLNTPTGPRRQVAAVDLPLARLRDAARANGGTVNDALLAAVTGALSAVLRARGEDPASLVVSVPVSARPRATTQELGNQVGVMAVRVPTHGPTASRIGQVAATTRAQKSSARGASASLVAPAFRLVAAVGMFRWMIDHQRLVNAFLTSMRGPQQPLRFAGIAVRRIVPVTLATGNVPVAFAALSHAGMITVAVIGDPDVVPDIDAIARTVGDELASLYDGEAHPLDYGSSSG
jgi:diacylglycerol O-acyltransferase